ncbi:hypothetical protein MUG91_G204n8 [Manis pentadactyla]|nr:hypothetical protein MUG91_G204n8 [Manis pentadactyla]
MGELRRELYERALASFDQVDKEQEPLSKEEINSILIRNPPVMFEVCKSKQQTQLREETATYPTTLHPQLQNSSLIARCLSDQTAQHH